MNEKLNEILTLLDEHYGGTKCYLEHTTPWQLLIATILSAQCTDDRVNIVTKDLFQKYRSVKDFAEADLAELEQDIRSTGFYHNKAKNIIACCQKLLMDYNGDGIPSIVVDTHVKRVSNLLGLTKNQDPVKIEFDLMKILPQDHWIRFNTQVIAHGRKVCIARRPQCQNCFLYSYCDSGKELYQPEKNK